MSYNGFETIPWEDEIEQKQFGQEIQCLEICFPKEYVKLCTRYNAPKSPIINSVGNAGFIMGNTKETLLGAILLLKSEIGYHVKSFFRSCGPNRGLSENDKYDYECFLDMMGFILEEKRKLESLTA